MRRRCRFILSKMNLHKKETVTEVVIAHCYRRHCRFVGAIIRPQNLFVKKNVNFLTIFSNWAVSQNILK